MRMTIRCSSFNYHALIAFIQTAFSPGLDSVIAAQHAVTTWLAPRVAAQARTSRTWTASFRIPSSSCQYHLQRAPIDSFAEGWAKVRRAALLNSPPLLLTAHRSTKPQGSRAAGRMVPSPAPRADLRSGFGAPRSTAGAISPRARSPRDGRLCRRRRRFRESLYRAPSALPVTAVPVPGVDEEDAVLACRGSTRTTAARPLHRAATVSYSSVLNRAAGSNESLPPSPNLISVQAFPLAFASIPTLHPPAPPGHTTGVRRSVRAANTNLRAHAQRRRRALPPRPTRPPAPSILDRWQVNHRGPSFGPPRLSCGHVRGRCSARADAHKARRWYGVESPAAQAGRLRASGVLARHRHCVLRFRGPGRSRLGSVSQCHYDASSRSRAGVQ